jgi:hypothetical protein
MNPCKSSGIRKILGQKEGYIVAIRILIVDDCEPWRISVRSILKRNPQLRVIGEARDGIEAIEKAATFAPGCRASGYRNAATEWNRSSQADQASVPRIEDYLPDARRQ